MTWSGIAPGDTCQEYDGGALADKSVQIQGTWGSATLDIQGSNDSTNFRTLRDESAADLTFTDNGGPKQIIEIVAKLKPVITGGTGSSITVSLFGRISSSIGA